MATLSEQGAGFPNEIVEGVGGKQILLEDPSGNLIELFEPGLPEARLDSTLMLALEPAAPRVGNVTLAARACPHPSEHRRSMVQPAAALLVR